MLNCFFEKLDKELERTCDSRSFFKERRDDRKIYIESYVNVKIGNQSPSDLAAIQQLEKKLCTNNEQLVICYF